MNNFEGMLGGVVDSAQGHFAERREEITKEADRRFAMALQDRGVKLSREQSEWEETRKVGLLNDPNSSVSLIEARRKEGQKNQNAFDANQGVLGHQRKMELERLKEKNSNSGSKQKIQKTKAMVGDQEIELIIEANSGLILDTFGANRRAISTEEAYKQLKNDQSWAGTFTDGMSDAEANGKIMEEAERLSAKSTIAAQMGIDPSRFVASFDGNEGLLGSQGEGKSGQEAGSPPPVTVLGVDGLGKPDPETVAQDSSDGDVLKNAGITLVRDKKRGNDLGSTPLGKSLSEGGLLNEAGKGVSKLADSTIGLAGATRDLYNHGVNEVKESLSKPARMNDRANKSDLSQFIEGKGTVERAELMIKHGKYYGYSDKQIELAKAFIRKYGN